MLRSIPDRQAKTYRLTEVFCSLQGEGVRAGTRNVFVRFAGCNLKCQRATHGFDCDTDFGERERLTAAALVARVHREWGSTIGTNPWVVLTGGEPLLQVDNGLVLRLHSAGFGVALETNGSKPLPQALFEWVAVSPKSQEVHVKVQGHIDELRYVRAAGQPIPRPRLVADHYCLSPAWTADGGMDVKNLEHCLMLIEENPRWRLSVQQHKIWGVR